VKTVAWNVVRIRIEAKSKMVSSTKV